MEKIKIHFDGSCQTNPFGQIGYGCLIEYPDGSGVELFDGDAASETNSNNVAEYKGLNLALNHLQGTKGYLIDIYGDSKLVISQMNGDWKVKDGFYKSEALRARELAINIMENKSKLKFTWIPREQNEKADELSNRYHENNSLDDRYLRLLRDNS